MQFEGGDEWKALYLGQLRVEHLLGREQRLQVGDEEREPRVVEGGQLLVELGVEQGERALGVF